MNSKSKKHNIKIILRIDDKTRSLEHVFFKKLSNDDISSWLWWSNDYDEFIEAKFRPILKESWHCCYETLAYGVNDNYCSEFPYYEVRYFKIIENGEWCEVCEKNESEVSVSVMMEEYSS